MTDNAKVQLTDRERKLVDALVCVTGALFEIKGKLEQENDSILVIGAVRKNGEIVNPFELSASALKEALGDDPHQAAKNYSEWPEHATVN